MTARKTATAVAVTPVVNAPEDQVSTSDLALVEALLGTSDLPNPDRGELATAIGKGGADLRHYAEKMAATFTLQDKLVGEGERSATVTAAYAVRAWSAYRTADAKPLPIKAIAAKIVGRSGKPVGDSYVSGLRNIATLLFEFGYDDSRESAAFRDLASRWLNAKAVKAEFDRLKPLVLADTATDATREAARVKLEEALKAAQSAPKGVTSGPSSPPDAASVGGSEADTGANGQEVTGSRGAGESGATKRETYRSNPARIDHMEALVTALDRTDSPAEWARVKVVFDMIEAWLDGADADTKSAGLKAAAEYVKA